MKQNEIRIEKVSNGFIVYENYGTDSLGTVNNGTIKVFNTTEQLNNYITENM